MKLNNVGHAPWNLRFTTQMGYKTFMKKIILSGIVVLSLAFVSLSKADDVLSNISATWSNGYVFNASFPALEGLAFQTGPTGGTINSLAFSLLAGNSPSPYPTITFSAYIYQLDPTTHMPTGAPLGTQDGLSATFTGPHTQNVFQQQTFSYTASDLSNLTSILLASNTQYALVLGNNDANSEYYWACSDPSTYQLLDGYSYVGFLQSTDNGSTWSESAPANGQAFIADISVTPQAVPEPTSLSLVGAGLACLLVKRSRVTKVS